MTDTPIPDDTSPLDPWTLEGLLAEGGGSDASPYRDVLGMSGLADLVAAARRPADETELVGEDAILAIFRDSGHGGISSTTVQRSRRSAMLSVLLGSKIALASAIGVLAVGGTSAAAYLNVLPEPVQEFAHHTIGAPAPKSATPTGPDASVDAAYGLCQAFAQEEARGKAENSVAYRNLAEAAGGTANVEAYCVQVRERKAERAGDPAENGDQVRQQDKDRVKQQDQDPTGDPSAAGGQLRQQQPTAGQATGSGGEPGDVGGVRNGGSSH